MRTARGTKADSFAYRIHTLSTRPLEGSDGSVLLAVMGFEIALFQHLDRVTRHSPSDPHSVRLDVPIYAVNSDFKPNDEASFTRHGIHLVVIPAVGHFVMMEDSDAFNTELNNILSILGQLERHS